MTEILPEIVLIDLSSIAYPIWHTSQSDPDPNATSTKTVARIRAIASGKPHVAICCDKGKSFRHEIAASYKANRPERDGTLQHQITLACEQLEGDGFPVWGIAGFEADDLIASATMRAIADDRSVLVVSGDKDLLQLVGPLVRAMSAVNGAIFDAEAVKAKFGVLPPQMRDYLMLVGDSSDNVAGAKGIGPKKAAELLGKFQTLENLYQQLESVGGATLGIQPSTAQSLREFGASGAMATALQLITLRTDAEVPFDSLFVERVPKDVQEPFRDSLDDDGDERDEAFIPVVATTTTPPTAVPEANASAPQNAITRREPEVIQAAPVEWQMELGPRSMREARVLAEDMFKSRLFSAYGTPQGVLSTVMLGRELGLPAMAALRGIHVIEGRHALSAQLMVALVIKSGFAEYFEPIEFDEQHAIFETHRKGARNPVRLTHTIEMAKTAGLLKKDSNWERVPTDMLVARAQSRLCRMVYPDIVGGLYTPDELAEIRVQVA